MLKTLKIVIMLFFIGCSSQPQAPVVINIAPSFPPQYFPNSSGNNRNIGNSYEENNNIQEINLEEEGEDEVNYEEGK
jgi:hypothetical protein